MPQTKNINTRTLFIEKVKTFFHAEKNFLANLQERWMDEFEYEDPEIYQDLIIQKAKNYNLKVSKVHMAYSNLSIKIIIENENNNRACIKVLKTKFQVEFN